MKNIRSLNELKAEQQKLDKRSSDMQDQIHSDWKIVRGVINTRNIFQFGLNCTYAEKNEPAHAAINGLKSVVGGLFHLLIKRTGDSIKSKLMEKIQSIIKNLFNK